MELRHLRYFLAVAEREHFTRASESLHVSQPTLSLQIKQLEEELGTPFFDRIGKRVRLTDAGRVFREHARRALREMEDAQIAINELEGLKRGAVTVGVVQTVNAYLVPQIVTRLSAEWPALQIKIEELANGKIEEGLVEGRLNVGVGFIPTTAAEIVAEPLFEEDLVLIVSANHKFANRKHVPVRELNGEPLVLLSKNFCTRRLTDVSLAEGGACPHIAIEMNSIEGILATVRAGGAATVLPSLAVGPGLPGIHAIKLTNPTPHRTVGMLWHRDGYRTAAARAFAKTVARVVEDTQPINGGTSTPRSQGSRARKQSKRSQSH